MQVFHARQAGVPSESRTGSATCTGTVWGDPIMPTTDNVTINNVFFAPGGRTHWHQHEQGQMLNVIAGSGWICLEGKPPQRIRTGDIVCSGAVRGSSALNINGETVCTGGCVTASADVFAVPVK